MNKSSTTARVEMLANARNRQEPFDVLIIGGGATGAGLALDAASRGFSVLLVEQNDFGKGTSSRSTKLVHGGVRYLEQGNIPLVMEALHERELLRLNAPHLVHDLPFIVPTYAFWEAPFYGIGLKVYDLLAGKAGFGKSKVLPAQQVVSAIPTIKQDGLKHGVLYHDGQFDDTRLLVALILTAVQKGAVILNYASAVGLTRSTTGRIDGAEIQDGESGEKFTVKARVVINATGAFTDEIRRLSRPDAERLISPSQGIHLVFDRSFLPGNTAIMVPHTSDGRVMFVIPWHDHALVGTTDTPIEKASLEPKPLAQEIDFVLSTASLYLAKAPRREDILSVFVGIRPLVKGGTSSTKALSRDHTIEIDDGGLLTICGGKWTTYRRMAKDGIDKAIESGGLPQVPCNTKELRLHGYQPLSSQMELPLPYSHLQVYGSEAAAILAIAAERAGWEERLHPSLPYIGAEVIHAARHEMCRTVEDFLARRVRALFLNAGAAQQMSSAVAELLAGELGFGRSWQEEQVRLFQELSRQYCVEPTKTTLAGSGKPGC
ncbi:MAG: FAD-dependent oxidoreductase [Candidatus Obscuribacter sp.]|nr:FAD-dependent oxidoreductase [Candidatus Obscuribacter sp.]